MSKDDLKIKPVSQELTKEDLKKINGGGCRELEIYCPDEGEACVSD